LILEQAKQWQADVIVMGTHGRRGIFRLAMGSDAEQVVRGAAIPVLLVRGQAQDTRQTCRNKRWLRGVTPHGETPAML
jgi:hypothetical protein